MLCTATAECNWTTCQMFEVNMTLIEPPLKFRILFSHLDKYYKMNMITKTDRV